MRHPRLVPSLAFLVLLAGAAPARATPADPAAPDAPEGADDRAARFLLAGNKAFKEGRFADAEQAYREAFAVKRGYDIAGNLGIAELAQGKLRACAEHLALTLRTFPVTGEPALRDQMARAFDQCRHGVGAVHVDTDVQGAVVLVDGIPHGETPLLDEVYVDPGAHVFEVQARGYTPAQQRVSVAQGGAVSVTLSPAPVPVVKTVVQVTPARRRSLAPGLVLGVLSIAGLAGGAAFLTVSLNKRSDARVLDTEILGHGGSCVAGAGNYDAARCPTLQSTLRTDDTFHNVAVGTFIAGSAAAVATLAYFVWPEPKGAARAPTTGRVRVTPVIGAGDGRVLLSGSF